jgi:hypothetical protein
MPSTGRKLELKAKDIDGSDRLTAGCVFTDSCVCRVVNTLSRQLAWEAAQNIHSARTESFNQNLCNFSLKYRYYCPLYMVQPHKFPLHLGHLHSTTHQSVISNSPVSQKLTKRKQQLQTTMNPVSSHTVQLTGPRTSTSCIAPNACTLITNMNNTTDERTATPTNQHRLQHKYCRIQNQTKGTSFIILSTAICSGPYLRTGHRGPGPGRQISRGGILKKNRDWSMVCGEKKAVHEREI